VKPFHLYTDIQPALQRPDVFLAITKYAKEPEAYRDLLHFPSRESINVFWVARNLLQLEVPSEVIPRLTNVGLQEERSFLAFTLCRLSVAPDLYPLRRPVPPSFWPALHDGLKVLHNQGFSYGHLRDDTVAVTDGGAPLLFDFMGMRSVAKQPPQADIEALTTLQARYG